MSIKELKVDKEIDITLEMMKYYQEEFMYRHKHYWDLVVKFFVLFVVVSTLPIISGILGVELKELSQKNLICFPLIGVIIAIFSRYILLGEVKRLAAVNKAKYRINRELLPTEYQYEFFDKKNKNEEKKRFSFQLPNIMFVFELLIAGCVALMIYM